ncbi:MAG TPA: PepSY-associated TM helix domain-containing protein [Phenylobacterium sp.]|nr:PepSY-associated TM helix domain-containing protein [Phenylobacterium sp.]
MTCLAASSGIAAPYPFAPCRCTSVQHPSKPAWPPRLRTAAQGHLRPQSLRPGELYRQLRLWHGYLSAFVFLAVIFVAATGLLLNRPGLIKTHVEGPTERRLVLTPEERAELRASSAPGPRIVAMVRRRMALLGALTSADRSGDDLFVRLQGARGSSDLRASMTTGDVEEIVEREPPLSVLNQLHRGELAGGPWRLFIDLAALLLILVSLAGYGLFLSLRFRWRIALALTVVSLFVMLGLFALTVSSAPSAVVFALDPQPRNSSVGGSSELARRTLSPTRLGAGPSPRPDQAARFAE